MWSRKLRLDLVPSDPIPASEGSRFQRLTTCQASRMGLSVCPSAVVAAPVGRVWDLLTSPEGFDTWADATLVAAEPHGAAQPGQQIHLVTGALGLKFAVTIDVLDVDAQSHRLRFLVHLPFGVVNDETVTMADTGEETLVRFG